MNKYLYCFAALLAVVSCNKEISVDSAVPDGAPVAELVRMTFRACPENLQTKADIDGNFVIWEAGDAIAVFDGAQFNKFEASDISSDGHTASFSGSNNYWVTIYFFRSWFSISSFICKVNYLFIIIIIIFIYCN